MRTKVVSDPVCIGKPNAADADTGSRKARRPSSRMAALATAASQTAAVLQYRVPVTSALVSSTIVSSLRARDHRTRLLRGAGGRFCDVDNEASAWVARPGIDSGRVPVLPIVRAGAPLCPVVPLKCSRLGLWSVAPPAERPGSTGGGGSSGAKERCQELGTASYLHRTWLFVDYGLDAPSHDTARSRYPPASSAPPQTRGGRMLRGSRLILLCPRAHGAARACPHGPRLPARTRPALLGGPGSTARRPAEGDEGVFREGCSTSSHKEGPASRQTPTPANARARAEPSVIHPDCRHYPDCHHYRCSGS